MLIVNNVTADGMKIAKGVNMCYLMDSKDKYEGYVQLKDFNDEIKIINRSSHESEWFYLIMITNLLKIEPLKEMRSDFMISLSSINSWVNLSKKSPLNIEVFDFVTNKYIEASEENYLKHPKNYFRGTLKEIVEINTLEHKSLGD